MEQHPVPQNVTTFQFRLIGDMTLKQFGYLAAGAILAYVAYKLPLPFIVTWPMAAVFALLGFGFAFVPVEERPMDVWVFSFFKSIYAPTQYIWSRTRAKQEPPLQPPLRQGSEGQAPPAQPTQVVKAGANPSGRLGARNTIAQLFAQRLASMSVPPPPKVTGVHVDAPPPAPLQPTPAPQPTVLTPSVQEKQLEEKIQTLTAELSTREASEARILELQKQLTDVLAEKNRMEHELLAMRQRANRPPFPMASPFSRTMPLPARSATPSVAGGRPVQPDPGPTVKVITQDVAVKSGLPRLTSVPNVVTGITKDNQGNFLPGVLVTVRDKEDIPLRALKTNKLGQFAASTPLPDGTYLVEVEDPRGRFIFDRAQVTLGGGVVPPLEITAKSQKELTRAKLASEIFGKTDI